MNPLFSPSSFSETPERLFVREYGHGGETFVMLHGIGADGTSWEPLIESMGLKNNTFICPDLLGHGESSYTPYLKYAPSTHTYFLERDVISKITMSSNKDSANKTFKPFHLVGFNLGSVLALELAIKNPSSIKSLTLISPPIYSSEQEAQDDLLSHLIYPKLRIPYVSRIAHTFLSQYDETFKLYLEDPNFSPQKIEVAKKIQAVSSSIIECFVKHRAELDIKTMYQQDNDFNLILGNREPKREIKKAIELQKVYSPNVKLSFIDGAGRGVVKTHSQDLANYFGEHIIDKE